MVEENLATLKKDFLQYRSIIFISHIIYYEIQCVHRKVSTEMLIIQVKT